MRKEIGVVYLKELVNVSYNPKKNVSVTNIFYMEHMHILLHQWQLII